MEPVDEIRSTAREIIQSLQRCSEVKTAEDAFGVLSYAMTEVLQNETGRTFRHEEFIWIMMCHWKLACKIHNIECDDKERLPSKHNFVHRLSKQLQS